MRTLAQISINERDRAAIADAVRLLRSRFPVERVILFGSKARGTDDPESDIDLLVLTSRELDRGERNALIDALFDIELDHDVVISPIILALKEWEQGICRVLPIRDEIDRDGVRL